MKTLVALTGKFDRWDTSLALSSPDVTSGSLDIRIDAATVNPGSSMKDNKRKSSDFFDVKENPTISGKGTGVGTIRGVMAFDRKDYGMTKGIPFVKIADRVEVEVDLK